MPKYLSPTSIAQFMDNEEEFFRKYIVRVGRLPQTKPMAVGSAFDACIKSYLDIYNEHGEVDPKKHEIRYKERFDDSVEPLNREWAFYPGIIVFNMYRNTGALDHFLADAEPGSVVTIDTIERELNGVPILGKPDLMYRSKKYDNEVIIVDWKCNGACSKSSVSPTPGYIDLFPSRAMHKSADVVDGVNQGEIHKNYRLQLTVYGLLANCSIVGIDQLVFGKADPSVEFGDCRVAIHRYKHDGGADILETAAKLWTLIQEYEPGKDFGSVPAKRCAELHKEGELMEDPTVRMLCGRS